MVCIFLAGAVVSGFLYIKSDLKKWKIGVYLFKPLTMFLIILAALLTETDRSLYKSLILVGLIISTTGDVFLMLPKDRFMAGLAAFLTAHLFYGAAFFFPAGMPVPWPLFPLLAYAGVVGILLFPYLEKMKVPVLVYGIVIMTMAWTAWSRFLVNRGPAAGIALAGALLFVSSDTLLAFRRFYRPQYLPHSPVMLLYFAAQICFALSTGDFNGSMVAR